MARKSVDNFDLTRWRQTPAEVVLRALSDYAKLDPDYRPRSDNSSSRWHAVVQGAHFEILCTGPKFLDTRASKGGGGAVDLAMHVLGVDFKSAVAVLRRRGL